MATYRIMLPNGRYFFIQWPLKWKRVDAADDSAGKILRIGATNDMEYVDATAASIPDGDKGDITTSGSGATWTIDNDAVTYAKMQNVSATDKVLGRSTAGAGDVEEIACNAGGRSLLVSFSGTATLAAGTVTVNHASVTATSRIMLSRKTLGSSPGHLYISAVVASTSFTITSTDGSDDADVNWLFFEP